MLLFSLLQMGGSSSKTTPLKRIKKKKKKKLGWVWSLQFKKTYLIFSCDIEWAQYPLEDREHWPVKGSLNYDTVLQLDQFCRKQEKKGRSTICVALYLSLRYSRLGSQGCRFGCETFSSPQSSYFAPASGVPNWTGWESGHPSRRGCFSLGRNSHSSNCGHDYLEDPKST